MKRINLDKNWTIYAQDIWLENKALATVDLPHDAAIGQDRQADAPSGASGGFFPGLDPVYAKTLATDPAWQGKRVLLTFEGVYQMAEISVNKNLACRRHYGYSTFHVDITPYLKKSGENSIFVKVANSAQPNSRWYTGSGIYRHVWLVVLDPVDIWPGDLFTYTRDWTPESASLAVQAKVTAAGGLSAGSAFQAVLLDKKGSIQAQKLIPAKELEAEDGKYNLDFALPLDSPFYWSPDSPYLYKLQLFYQDGSKKTLLQEQECGLRQLEINARQGFLLNGQPLKLRGGCVHHDNGPLGAASYDTAEERKVRLLKAAGYNAVRCAHNPPAPAFLDACDRLGLLVINELCDVWREGKRPYDYHMAFASDWQDDLRDLVLRDRNHPSVIMWSTGNEILERDGRSDGYIWARRLADLFRFYDPTRPVTNAISGLNPDAQEVGNLADNVQLAGANADYWAARTKEFARPLDVVGYNYMPQRYSGDREKFPGRVICGLESFPLDVASIWDQIADQPHVIGDFVWTAIDYLGEAGLGHVWYDDNEEFLGDFPWHMANCGDYDLCGFARPQLELRKRVWGQEEKPYLAVLRPDRPQDKARVSAWGWPELLPFWDWSGFEGELLQVVVYAAAKTIKLYLEDRLIGSQPCTKEQGFQCSFTVPYQAGSLRAESWNGDQLVGVSELATPGPATRLVLEKEKATGLDSQKDGLAYLTVTVTDAAGRRVRLADRPVTVAVSGQGRLKVLASSDPLSDAPYRGNQRCSFEGRLLAIIAPAAKAGPVLVTAVAEGLEPAKLQLSCR